MFQIFFRNYPTLLLILCTVLLSSCASDKHFSFLPEFDTQESEPDIHLSDDPDLQLVSTEPEICLDQELAQLSQTGQWGDKTSAVSLADTADIVAYDFPVTMNKQVEMYLDMFRNKQRKHFEKWLNRSTRYLPMMHEELRKAGLPLDLAYLSMIESGYNQRACSKARAVGLWQFMQATGRQYNLKVDEYVDERRDAEKSTKAAVAFLADLYKEFGDWHLAVAAYNAGPGKIRSGLRRHQVDNFWDLARQRHLSLETKRYVPKLIAAIIISREPEKYGFTGVTYQEQLAYETLDVGPGMSLEAIAVISGSNTQEIKTLNQELRKGKTPLNQSHYAVKIPPATYELAGRNLSRLHSVVSTGFKTHKIRHGETLSAICRKYDINKTTLLKVNNLHSSKLIVGRNLRIPFSTVKYQLLPENGNRSLAAFKDNLILHRILPGETISKIAKKHRVPKEMIVAWNGLKSEHKIRAGRQLALYIINENSAQPAMAATAASKGVEDTSSSAGGVSHVPVLTERKKNVSYKVKQSDVYSWYKVKNGDSLWTISRKFNTSAAQIRQWNNLTSNLIHPGSRLKVKNV